ncbi:hypothetical protein C0J50_23925 [Silurus asotus]|uniref:Uncharacterized protein n=1 Tax=Silurus asotus TaxID=30991 RepID=A0AAD5AI16_SILAS|nr:hypothetical protein C0J50_23925 [Silurus asotus]
MKTLVLVLVLAMMLMNVKHFRKCMTKKDCRVYDETPNVHAVCCQVNNCN